MLGEPSLDQKRIKLQFTTTCNESEVQFNNYPSLFRKSKDKDQGF